MDDMRACMLADSDVNECASNPCLHGSTCIDHANSFTCNCATGYTGTQCETGQCMFAVAHSSSFGRNHSSACVIKLFASRRSIIEDLVMS